MEITGTIHEVGNTEEFASGFKKRHLILEVIEGAYTNHYGVQVFKDRVSIFDKLEKGMDVTVEVFDNTVGKVREYNGAWYSDMPTCMKVHVNDAEAETPHGDQEDDVPF